MKSEVRNRAAALLGALLLLGSVSAAVTLDIPDSLYGNTLDTLEVPVLVSGQSGHNIISADLALGFREEVLVATAGFRLGAAASGWFAAVNPFSCSLLVAMAGATPLAAGDTLLVLQMVPQIADTSTIDFLRAELNEGQYPCTTDAGMFYGYGTGIEERAEGGGMRAELRIPTLVRATLHLPGDEDAVLLDAAGRLKVILHPGENDIRHVREGVYILVQNRRVVKLVKQD